jgi:hypothetical protein
MSALSTVVSDLQREAALGHLLIVKHTNQHRRTRYWRAFVQLHKLATRVAAHMLQPLTVWRSASPESLAAYRASAGACASAHATALALATRLTAPHKGAGFAALAAVILASAAVYVDLLRRATAALEGGFAPAAAAAPPRPASRGDGSAALPASLPAKRPRTEAAAAPYFVIDKSVRRADG